MLPLIGNDRGSLCPAACNRRFGRGLLPHRLYRTLYEACLLRPIILVGSASLACFIANGGARSYTADSPPSICHDLSTASRNVLDQGHPAALTQDSQKLAKISVPAGADIHAIVSQASEGATFRLEPGLHRLSTPIVPKNNQTFLGTKNTILNGSELVTSFTRVGSYWMIPNQTQQGWRNATDQSEPDASRAGFPETVFIDDKPLKPVDILLKLKPGHFYFDYENDQIYIADDPTNRKVEIGKAPSAFASKARGVTVVSLTVEKFNSPIQVGAIDGNRDWTIVNNVVRLNYGIGITGQSGSKIIGNRVYDNGQMGIGGAGDNILVEGNEIFRNGFWSGIDVFWEGGGAKFAVGDGLVVRGNYSHDNKGFGLWTDIDNTNSLYENNLIVNNSGGGITHEISYNAVIRNNILIGNGFADQGGGTRGNPNWMWGSQIQLQNSKNVEVYGNRIDMTDSGNGIGLIQQNRGTGKYGAYTTTGNRIYDNDIVLRSGNGRSGGAADYNEKAMLKGGNVWSRNRYYMPDGDRWWWGNYGRRRSWDTYIERARQDEGSSLLRSYPDTASWFAAWTIPNQCPDPVLPRCDVHEHC